MFANYAENPFDSLTHSMQYDLCEVKKSKVFDTKAQMANFTVYPK